MASIKMFTRNQKVILDRMSYNKWYSPVALRASLGTLNNLAKRGVIEKMNVADGVVSSKVNLFRRK